MDIYYKIWIDCILRIRAQKQNKETWAEWSMTAMSFAMTLNFLLFMAILQANILGCYFYKLNIPDLSYRENNIFTIVILFVFPVFTINYILIFWKKRCKKLVRKYKYPSYNGKLAIPYVMISLFLPVVLLFLHIFINQGVTLEDFFPK